MMRVQNRRMGRKHTTVILRNFRFFNNQLAMRAQRECTGTALRWKKQAYQAGVPASSKTLLFLDIFVTLFGVTRFFFRLVLTD